MILTYGSGDFSSFCQYLDQQTVGAFVERVETHPALGSVRRGKNIAGFAGGVGAQHQDADRRAPERFRGAHLPVGVFRRIRQRESRHKITGVQIECLPAQSQTFGRIGTHDMSCDGIKLRNIGVNSIGINPDGSAFYFSPIRVEGLVQRP